MMGKLKFCELSIYSLCFRIDADDLPTTSEVILEDELEFYVEEPEESGQLVLHDDLSNFLKRMKSEPIVPLQPKPNNALVLYRPEESIRSRIVEITDADSSEDEQQDQSQVEMQDSTTPATSPIHQNEMESNEDVEQMEID
jgi:hypothetical protein